ncbi:hypothetical protein [Tenacibaculum phage Larrie]|nr:hypothetical protein [Tenacibaculum phage Larrie]
MNKTPYEKAKGLLTRFSLPKAKHWQAIFGKIDEVEQGAGSKLAGNLKVLADIPNLSDLSTVLSAQTPADIKDAVYLAKIGGQLRLISEEIDREAIGSSIYYTFPTPSGTSINFNIVGENGEVLKDSVWSEVLDSDIPSTVRVFELDSWAAEIGTNVIIGNIYSFEAVNFGSFEPLQFNFGSAGILNIAEAIGGIYTQGSGSVAPTLTIPDITDLTSDSGFPTKGRQKKVEVLNLGTDPLTIQGAAGVTILTTLADTTVPLNEKRTLYVSNTTNTWILTN